MSYSVRDGRRRRGRNTFRENKCVKCECVCVSIIKNIFWIGHFLACDSCVHTHTHAEPTVYALNIYTCKYFYVWYLCIHAWIACNLHDRVVELSCIDNSTENFLSPHNEVSTKICNEDKLLVLLPFTPYSFEVKSYRKLRFH